MTPRTTLSTVLTSAVLGLGLAALTACGSTDPVPDASASGASASEAPASDDTATGATTTAEEPADSDASGPDLTAVPLPDGWPTTIPLPAEHTVIDTMTYPHAGEEHYFVGLHSPQDGATLADDLDSRIQTAGFTQNNREDSVHPGLGGAFVLAHYDGPTHSLELTVHDYQDGGTYVQLKTSPLG